MIAKSSPSRGFAPGTPARKRTGVSVTIVINRLLYRPLECQRLSDDELDVIDLVMLDIKTWDPERHKRLTGMDVEPTLEFARRLAARKRRCGFAMFSSQA